MAVADLLKGCPLFFDLFDDEISRIVGSERVMHFKPGEKIIECSKEGGEIYILLEGIAQLEKQVGDSCKKEKFKQGEVFGLLVLLDRRDYGIDVVASTHCSVLELGHEKIMNLFKSNPRSFGLICLNISRILAGRLQEKRAS